MGAHGLAANIDVSYTLFVTDALLHDLNEGHHQSPTTAGSIDELLLLRWQTPSK